MALESLEIWNCGKIDLVEGEDYPTRLRSLTIGVLPKLVALPQWLIQSALRDPKIYDCGVVSKNCKSEVGVDSTHPSNPIFGSD